MDSMDVEKIQKINKLAKELLDHGVVKDSEEATRQAEAIIDKEKRMSSMQSQSSQPSQVSTISQGSYSQRIEDPDLKLEVRKLAYKINDQAKLVSEINDAVKRLSSELESLKQQRKQEKPVMQQSSGEEQMHFSKDQTTKPSHPKIGGFESQDVAIDRIFYSGPPKGDD